MRLLILLIWCSLGFGCASSPSVKPARAGRAGASQAKQGPALQPGGVTGTWDWVLRGPTPEGDLRIEQEEWHLSQDGLRVFGYYERQVVTLSTDQRPFRCNGALGYTRTTRVRVAGELRGQRSSREARGAAGIELRELSADTQPGPCDDGVRQLTSYTGEVQGDSLVLHYGPGGLQYLTRRVGVGASGDDRAATAAAAQRRPAAAPGLTMDFDLARGGAPQLGRTGAQRSGGGLDGLWEWQLNTVDSEGDLRQEREEWHLREADDEISGYYERTVRRSRPGGTFPCNGAAEIHNVTRYKLRGQRFGDRLTLSEIDFTTEASACDNALRRLDTYRGAVSPTGQEMILSWGTGSQLLRRRPAEGP